jgi:YHS domain-containing protein
MTEANEVTAASSSCCSTRAPSPGIVDTGRLNLLDAAGEESVTCPVMGGAAKKKSSEAAGLYRDYDGNRYWFCCAGCGPAFDADPAKYAA